jgi:hypothetical protein
VSVPEGEYFYAVRVCVDLVVEVVAGAAQKEPANSSLLRAPSARADSGLGRNKFKGPLEVFHEGERSCRTIGAPPRRSAPDL